MGKITNPVAKDIEQYMWEAFKSDEKVTALTSVHIRAGLKEHSRDKISTAINTLIRNGIVQRRRELKLYYQSGPRGGRGAAWLSLTAVLRKMDEDKMPSEVTSTEQPNELTGQPKTGYATVLDLAKWVEKIQKSIGASEERKTNEIDDLGREARNIRTLISGLNERITENQAKQTPEDFVNGFQAGFSAGIETAQKHNLR